MRREANGRNRFGLGDRGVGGGGQGLRGMGAFGGDAGEEPVEVSPRVEAAPQAAADQAVKDGTARAAALSPPPRRHGAISHATPS